MLPECSRCDALSAPSYAAFGPFRHCWLDEEKAASKIAAILRHHDGAVVAAIARFSSCQWPSVNRWQPAAPAPAYSLHSGTFD